MINLFNLFLTLILVSAPWMVHSQVYALKEISTEASCSSYEIIDSSGKKVSLPLHVSGALQCPSLLTLRGNLLVYRVNNTIAIFNIEDATDLSLFCVSDDEMEISGTAWSPSGMKLAFVIINQNRTGGYLFDTRIVVVTLGNGPKVERVWQYNRPVRYSCGSICFSEAGVDFRFLDENNFEYVVHQDPDSALRRGYIYLW